MKIFLLKPVQEAGYLPPDEIVNRFRKSFLNVNVNAGAARKQGELILVKYRMLVEAGLGSPNSMTLEVIENRWSGALSLVVRTGDQDGEWFQTMACQASPLSLAFGSGIPGRKRRGVADNAAAVLGYIVESVDGD